MKLTQLKKGNTAVILTVGGEDALRQHFLDLGLIPGTAVKMLGAAPMGDPLEVQTHGYSLSLSKEFAGNITVGETVPVKEEKTPADKADENFGYNLTLHEHNAHPGYGEGGHYHNREDDKGALPKDAKLTFAIVGQPNSGKTALFNQLTGANLHVGNFPGVTVEMTEGEMKGYPNSRVVDMPGIYSLTPYTSQEKISRDFILSGKPDCIINVADASNLERNLYLTVQLMELDIPVVLAINMVDELRGNGGHIRINEMERILGIPVVSVSASRNEGIDELARHAEHIARYRELPVRQDLCDPSDCGGSVHRCLHSIMHLVEDHCKEKQIPVRYAADKLVEQDPYITEMLNLSSEDKDAIDHIVAQMERERGLDRAAAVADMRFNFVKKLCERTLKRPSESKEYKLSRRIDKVLTGKWTAIPIFVLVMCLVIVLSIDVLGAPLQNLLEMGIAALSGSCDVLLSSSNVSPAIRSLVVNGIFGGVGAVVSFVPILLILFFFLSMLEDSGYMSRVAFVTDKLLRRIGLSGRSIVPLMIGFGCSVPAIMATRTLPSARDRMRTIMLIPYISCSAKITIYAFLSNTFFPGKGGLVLAILYVSAILVGIVITLLHNLLSKSSKPSPFVMEMPNYRLPQMRNVGHLLWDKTKDFLQMAFSVILIASIVIWFLQSFDWRFNMVEGGNGSILAWIAGLMEPIFVPLGLGDWRLITALISGFMAKESVVATMGVLNAVAVLTVPSAVSMLAFCLLYTPCVAAIAAAKRELGIWWALFLIVFQCTVAWIVAFAAYNVALLLV